VRALLAAITCHKDRPNLANHLAVMELAADQGCDVVVLPEFSLTGSVDPLRQSERAVALDSDVVNEVVAATARLGLAAVFGVAERDGEDFYISQLVAAGGELRGRHRKRHLGDDELGYSLGTEARAFSVRGTCFGLVVCAEGGAEFTWREVAAAGASVTFFCSAPGLYGRRTDDTEWRAGLDWWESCGLADARRQAQAHGLWVAMATQAGATVDEDFPGLAALINPAGEVVSRSPDWHPSLLVVDIPV
jgi:predicted amidohydrolase